MLRTASCLDLFTFMI